MTQIIGKGHAGRLMAFDNIKGEWELFDDFKPNIPANTYDKEWAEGVIREREYSITGVEIVVWP